jgi:hypothetical protein
MALPADWNANDQHRMAKLDRELQAALQTVRKSVVAAKGIKQRFTALSLSARWPSLTTDYVHYDPDAHTRQEQVDAGNLVDYMCNTLLGDGTATSQTSTQASALLSRYANG